MKNGRGCLEIGMELESSGGSWVVESEICIPVMGWGLEVARIVETL